MARKPRSTRRKIKPFFPASGSVTVVTNVTKGSTRGTLQIQTTTLRFSNGQFEGALGGGSRQVDLF